MSQNNRLRIDKSMELHSRLSFILSNKDGSVNHRASIVTGNATPSATDNLHKRVKSLHLDQSYDKSGKGYDGSLPRINSIAFTKKDLKQPSKIMGMTPASNNHKKQASYLLDKSTAAEHVSVISDSRSNNANHGLSIIASRNLPRKSKLTMLTGRCNFSELKKTDVLRIVDRSTALSLKDDPIAIERLIRHNREAEINHFVSLVRQKVEKDTNHFAAMDLDFIDKDWLTTNGTFKIKLNDSLTQTENVRELDLLKQGKSIHETGAPFRTAGQRFMIKREPSVHILPKTTGNLSMLKEVSKDEMRVESNQEIKTDHPLSIPPPKVIRFLNPSAYDGQKEIKRMEEQFSLILDKLKSPKLVMKLPEGTVVPNRHLTDFYFVKKMHPKLRNTELKLSTNESIEDMVDNKSALLDVLEFDESHPIEEASGVEEETIKYGSEDYKNNPNDKGKKKKWVKKTNQQVTKSPTSKKSSTNNLLLKPFPENPITGGSSTRELINTKQNSFKNISTPSFTGIDRMIDSTISKKQLPPYNSYWLQRINEMLEYDGDNETVFDIDRPGYYYKMKVKASQPALAPIKDLPVTDRMVYQQMYFMFSKVNIDLIQERPSIEYSRQNMDSTSPDNAYLLN